MPRPVRLPTQVGYSIIGIGFGMLAACQLFKLHDIQVEESSLFGYGCHEEESKPIMRGVLHTVACVVCLASMTFQYVAKGSSRHPSDFVMAYFLAQYFASATYHRARYSPIIVSTFTVVDMGWIAATIVGGSQIIKFKKVRYVLFTFATFVGLAFLYEIAAHGLPDAHSEIHAGAWIDNLKNMKNNEAIKHFVYSLSIDPYVWIGCKTLSGISFALVPFFSPIALNFGTYTRQQKVLYVLCIGTFLLSFVCFGLQTASRSGMEFKLVWHVENVWGFHEDFHLILCMAHTFTSQLYDVVYESDVGETPMDTINRILERINHEYKNEYESLAYMKKHMKVVTTPGKSLSGLKIREKMGERVEEMKRLRERLNSNILNMANQVPVLSLGGMGGLVGKSTGEEERGRSRAGGEKRERSKTPSKSRSKTPTKRSSSGAPTPRSSSRVRKQAPRPFMVK